MKILLEIVGAIGAVLILGAYLLISYHVLPVNNVYQVLVLVGSICLLYVSYKMRIWSMVILDIAWVIIATAALMNNAHLL